MINDRNIQHVNPSDDQIHLAGSFKYQLTFINESEHSFVAVDRNNIPILIRGYDGNPNYHPIVANTTIGTLKYNNNRLVIRKSYLFTNIDDVRNTYRLLESFKKELTTANPEMEIVFTTLFNYCKENTFRKDYRVIIDRYVTVDQCKSEGIFYLRDCDLLLQYGDYTPNMCHPYSVEGSTNQEYKEAFKDRKSSGIMIDIIDNNDVIKDRFVKLLNRVHRIPVQKDAEKDSGVYVTTFDCNKIGDPAVKSRHYSFEEAETELNIHRTSEEAEHHNYNDGADKIRLAELERLNNERKIQLEEGKLELEQRKIELSNIKHQHETEMIGINRQVEEIKFNYQQQIQDNEAELAKLKNKLEKIKIKSTEKKDKIEKKSLKRKNRYEDRSAVRNDYYETRNYERKDSYETVKTVGMLTAAGLSLYAIFGKK